MRTKKILISLLLTLLPSPIVTSFEKVIIWGHKIHSHTHSYIHNGFYRAFQHLGYPTYWFDDTDDVSRFDFSNSLFITEGQVDLNIPLRPDCHYVLHYCDNVKYQELITKGNAIILQVYNTDFYQYDSLGNPILSSQPDLAQLIQLGPCIYYDPQGRRVFMPWATDLLPNEIDEIKNKLPTIEKEKSVYWVGTIGSGPGGNIDEISPFSIACEAHGIAFIHKNPWTNGGISIDDHIALIQKSYLAPAIVGTWQNKVGYIPCRIFKNISYGQFGITNSQTVNELFEGRIIYNSNTEKLFEDAQKKLETITLNEIYELMDFVKTKHTFLNRIQTLLDCFNLIQISSESVRGGGG